MRDAPDRDLVAESPVRGERSLDPRRLLVLAEVARHGSLTAAAHALGWTQPAVAQHVKALEREAGCELVVRTSRGVVLTEAGRTLAEHAGAIAARLHAAREDLRALAELRTGRVRLAAFPSACATLVPDALADLGARSPGLDVRLTEAEPALARTLLADGEVDLAVTFDYGPGDRDDPATVRTPLLADPMLLVVPRDHPLARLEQVDLADAADERWVAGCPECRTHLVGAAAAQGFTPEIRHSTDDYVVTQTLVAAGLGVALLPSLALRAVRDAGVATLSPRGHPPRTVTLERRADLPPSAAVRAVAAALEQVAALSG